MGNPQSPITGCSPINPGRTPPFWNRLETGRTHQIRVHMKYIGHPLYGDFLYNPDYRFLNRQSLHSWKLSFLHPVTRDPMEFTADIPEDIQQFFHCT